ncbi:hypothetical protein GGC65_001176 [Sphingopyxis sp. OAS728]|nr:hypothetical protein [Sphingopyxis sp. OAS728]
MNAVTGIRMKNPAHITVAPFKGKLLDPQPAMI